jgi:hypothetical protein
MRTDSLRHSSRHWKQWATALRQEYSARPKSARAIDASDCSSWPTATAEEYGAGPSLMERRAKYQKKYGNNGFGLTLGQMVKTTWQTPRACSGERSSGGNRTELVNAWSTPRASDGEKGGLNSRDGSGSVHLTSMAQQWRTPSDISRRGCSQAPEKRKSGGHTVNLEDQAEHWPTPISRDHRSIYAGEETMAKNSRPLSEAASRFSHQDHPIPDGQTSSDERRTLNQRFVEWMHGWPIGWTSFGPVETASQVWLRRMRGALLMLLSAPTPEPQGQIPLFAEEVA